MNRTTLIIAIGIIIAVCTGIYFWTEWQKQEFDASLPTPPAEDTAGGHWHGDEWHAEPHVADEAPPVQPVTEPAAEVTEDTEAARRRIEALELPPDELDLENEAIQADFNALLEQRGSLSPAEFDKRLIDNLRRLNALTRKRSEQAKERVAAYRKMEAERQADRESQ